MAAHWHKSGMKKISSLSDCCKGSAKCCVRTMAVSQKYPEAFHLRRKSNPIAPFEMASGLLQFRVLAWRASLGRGSAFIGMGQRAKHLPIQFQSALLLLQSADKSID
jgi:hypothetical protein